MDQQKSKRRDRWASSSSEDDDRVNARRQKPVAVSKKKKVAASSRVHNASYQIDNGIVDTKQNDDDDNTVTSVSSPSLHLPLHNPLISGCRSVYDTYERIERVSEGSYGIVWKAREIATGNYAALKQIKFHPGMSSDSTTSFTTTSSMVHGIWKEGFPVTALREISVLLALQHESIVSVKEMVVGDAIDQVYMVMEYFECDLKEALRKSSTTGGPLAQSELKGILQQILAGTQYMHGLRYLHRDLKPSNILVKMSANNDVAANNNGTTTTTNRGGGGGRIALADFGSARRYHVGQSMTLPVCTLWYRAPELLFGESQYSPAVDMWSLGCIMGELIQSGGGGTHNKMDGTNGFDDDDDDYDSNAIMKGEGELDQIDQIFAMVGVPDNSTWPTFDQLPNARLFRWKSIPESEIRLPKQFPIASVGLSSRQTFLDHNGYNLLKGLLTLDPSQRLTATQAYNHPYFTQGVAPQIPHFFTSSSNNT